MESPLSPYSHCILFTSNAFARTLSKISEPFFAELGLTTTQAFLLMSIVREPGISAGKLSEELILEPSTITRALDKMELKRLIYREYSGASTIVFAGPEGTKLEKDAAAAWGKIRLYYEGRFSKEITDRWASDLDFGTASLRNDLKP
ncbi:MAG: MarR family transcriptional regulator [Flavobacteriales bacterium]|nr:MarR family transcriptional regulator [Flavobacteriales bacterium]